MKAKLKISTKYLFWVLVIMRYGLIFSDSTTVNSLKNEEQITETNDFNRSIQMLPYHVLPVYGNASLGYYYVNIFIGSPNPQPQSVIVDTGSGILAMPCKSCKQCGVKNHIHPPYDPQKSVSSSRLTCQSNNPICHDKCRYKQKTDLCQFSIHYAEGSSLQGTIVEDDIRLQSQGKNEQIRTGFGCTEKQTKLFFQQKANGIFGLAPKRQSNLLQQMFKQHSLYNGQKKIFSLCLSSNGGLMTVGGINQKLHPEKTVPDLSIPYNDSSNLYSLIGVKEMSIGQTLIISVLDRVGGYGIFIDSGSTFSYVPEAKYTQVQKLLNETCIDSKRCQIGRGQDSICYRLNLKSDQNLFEELNKLFPAIEINIYNKRIEWLPTKYMLLRELKNNEVCMGLQPLNRYLLGANWMYDRDIVFDLSEKKVHIFDNVQCVDKTQIMGQYSSKIQNNTQVIYTDEKIPNKGIKVNVTKVILSVICLATAALVAFILWVMGLCNKSNTVQISQNDEEDQRTMEGVQKNIEPQIGNSQA